MRKGGLKKRRSWTSARTTSKTAWEGDEMPIWRKTTGVVVSAVTTWQTDEAAAVATVATETTAAAASAETGLTIGTTDVAATARGSAETATWTWEVPWEG